MVTRATNGCRIEIFDLSDPEPRVPRAIKNFTLGAADGGAGVTNLPLECAIVNSFQGAKVAGLPQSRRRGRIFFGPLRSLAFDGGTPSVVTSNVLQNLPAASKRLRAAVISDLGGLWVVWSETDQNPVTITDGWVDNDPDTQRRRGVRPTSRTVWTP